MQSEQQLRRRVIVVVIIGDSLMRGSGGGVVIVSGCTLLVPLDDLLPSILLDHVSKLDYKLALFILLARLERVLVFPPKGGLAALAVNVSDSMKAS